MLILPLLGERPYLHGTTLFEALQPRCPEGASLTFKISRMLLTDRVELRSVTGATNASASLEWRFGSVTDGISVYPLTPSPAPTRAPYDEERVTSRAVYDRQQRRIELSSDPPFPLAATLVPLMKRLLSDCVDPPGKGQWLFTRLDLEELPDDFCPVSLEYGGAVNKGRLVRAKILLKRRIHGMLFFSWLSKGNDVSKP
jgi:hypothetical protein